MAFVFSSTPIANIRSSLRSLREPAPPEIGVSFDMSDRNHLDQAGLENINYGVREPANQRPTGAPIHYGLAKWVVCYPLKNRLELAENSNPKPSRPCWYH
jgi:hypothetical protein